MKAIANDRYLTLATEDKKSDGRRKLKHKEGTQTRKG